MQVWFLSRTPGSPELIDLSPVALGEEDLRTPFSDLWQEVALNAPDEVVRALCAAKAPLAEAATALIARGLAARPRPTHPLPAAVVRAEDDPGLAACARTLTPRFAPAAPTDARVTPVKDGPPADDHPTQTGG